MSGIARLKVPGSTIIGNKITVGDMVTVNVINSNITTSTPDEMLDNRLSGDFMIYNTKHMFVNGRHDVVLSICKLVDL